jgi:hypothetical protein
MANAALCFLQVTTKVLVTKFETLVIEEMDGIVGVDWPAPKSGVREERLDVI